MPATHAGRRFSLSTLSFLNKTNPFHESLVSLRWAMDSLIRGVQKKRMVHLVTGISLDLDLFRKMSKQGRRINL